ncbi:MAG: HD domain-containing protein [Bacteroidales bacterium]|nr:HD domain-containing protein [Bacteroidales bacterium]
MIAEKIIKKYYPENSQAYSYFYIHSIKVTENAVKIAKHNYRLDPDIEFIKNAAMLHDIGIFLTNASDIGCFGKFPYIAHGYLGRELLEKEGLDKYALVCERHVGVGITLNDIEKNNLPLPKRDMIPLSIEEKIICYADKFYSKSSKYLETPKPEKKIKKNLLKYGKDKLAIFEEFIALFGIDYIYE